MTLSIHLTLDPGPEPGAPRTSYVRDADALYEEWSRPDVGRLSRRIDAIRNPRGLPHRPKREPHPVRIARRGSGVRQLSAYWAATSLPLPADSLVETTYTRFLASRPATPELFGAIRLPSAVHSGRTQVHRLLADSEGAQLRLRYGFVRFVMVSWCDCLTKRSPQNAKVSSTQVAMSTPAAARVSQWLPARMRYSMDRVLNKTVGRGQTLMRARRTTPTFLAIDDCKMVVCAASAAITRNGQCKRYQEYDHRPTVRNGVVPITDSAPIEGTALPPTMTKAAPSTGRRVTQPG